jgi:hypothetical protein
LKPAELLKLPQAAEQISLVSTLEDVCCSVYPKSAQLHAEATSGADVVALPFLPLAANLLKHLYEAEIVEEEAIMAWADKSLARHSSFKTAVQPIVDWLKAAEEEEEEEEDGL